MTERHYAQASSVSNVKIARLDSLLTFGRAPSVEPESLTQLVLKMSTEQREEWMSAIVLSRQNGSSNSH